MTLVVTLFDKLTKQTKEYTEPYDPTHKEYTHFLWTEGNYACDCQRSQFMYSDTRYGCNDDNIYILKAVIKETGEVFITNELGNKNERHLRD